MTGERGEVSSSCCATGALRPGADCEMAVKFHLNRSTAFVKCSHIDQVILLRLQRTASRIRTGEIAGMGKVTAGRRYAVVVTFLRRLPLANESLFLCFAWGSRTASPTALSRVGSPPVGVQNLAPNR